MHFLVVGRGWTGRKVFEKLVDTGNVVTLAPHDEALDVLANGTYFDWVVNCAGVTGTPNVDACELNKPNTLYGNAVYPVKLYEAADKNGCRMSHFSSGCIYSGDITDVNAAPNFFGSTYSVAKGVSDVLLGDKAQVYRIRMPFTGNAEPKNYLYKVYNYAKNGKLIDAGQNSLTDLDEAIDVAIDLMIHDEDNGYYNLVNSGSVNMHELVEIMGINPQWFTPEEFRASTATGRSTCTIPAYHAMSDVKEALVRAVASMKAQLY
jgi:dTDP-4-dehydrorhamnose reductase